MTQTSAQRKLARGIEQAKSLYGETKAFEDSQAYVLRTERERRSAEAIRYVAYAVERERPSPDLPLILGEIVHNLRAALDHVVYAQVKPRARSRRTGFPVFIDECEFQVRGRPMLRGVKPAVKAIIENAQPFKAPIPKFAPLYILHDLWNIDKHRELVTVAASVHVSLIGFDGPLQKGAEMMVDEWGSGLILEDGAPVITFSVVGPKANEVKVDPKFSYEVRAEGRPVTKMLSQIADVAQRLVMECEAGVPLPPLMPSALLDWPATTLISY